ncbi:hypothetical protein CRG98_001292 [Punica granatum]|uniref:Uncharacterized protein n=1 Tax=Punica granatum TaxID=22663 RepID=A0A2I0LCE5_PUNGR|nr:hypothetical protein CRG98_001292 [Punica granatum]
MANSIMACLVHGNKRESKFPFQAGSVPTFLSAKLKSRKIPQPQPPLDSAAAAIAAVAATRPPPSNLWPTSLGRSRHEETRSRLIMLKSHRQSFSCLSLFFFHCVVASIVVVVPCLCRLFHRQNRGKPALEREKSRLARSRDRTLGLGWRGQCEPTRGAHGPRGSRSHG